MRPSAILIAAAAGLASALLFAGLVLQSTSAIGLALAAPIPIAIASLGWGSLAGFVSAAFACATIYVVTQSLPSTVMLLVTMAGPMAVAGHLAGLARPSQTGPEIAPQGDRKRPMLGDGGQPPRREPALDWYPLARLLVAITAMAIAACLFLGWLLGFDPEQYVAAIVAALRQGGGAATASDVELQNLASVIIGLVPFVQPAILTITLVLALYVGAAITRLSGRLPRPKDDVPTQTALPRTTLAVFLAALAGAFAGGTIGLIAAVVVGGLTAAFTLVGLAVLHRRSRGKTGRGLILFSAYAAIVFLSFPIALFAMMGLFETYRGPQVPTPLA